MIGYGLVLVILVAIAVFFTHKLWRAIITLRITLQGPFYCPTSDERLETVLKLAQVKKGIKAVDLGSGDGRVVVALAQAGASTTGFEIDPELVKTSRQLIAENKLEKKATVSDQSFWEADVSKYDLVVVYCNQKFMPKLEKKLKRELKSGARIVSVYFQFPHWKRAKTENEVHLYLKN